jgi:hypothetical protein
MEPESILHNQEPQFQQQRVLLLRDSHQDLRQERARASHTQQHLLLLRKIGTLNLALMEKRFPITPQSTERFTTIVTNHEIRHLAVSGLEFIL